jgi:ATP-binding cassette subfamily F protein uup
MSFKEQRELAALPAEIEVLEQEQQALTARMSSADYHKQGADAIKGDSKRAGEIEQQLAKKYERWEVLDQKAAAGAS